MVGVQGHDSHYEVGGPDRLGDSWDQDLKVVLVFQANQIRNTQVNDPTN